MNFVRSIEDVVLAVERAKEESININILIGAGCSVSAGISTAKGILKIIKEKYPREYERASCKDYATCMSKLTPSERKNLIESLVKKAKINWAHIAIAQLMKLGYIDRILTTNFDNLVQRACSFVSEFPSIYDLASTNVLRTDMSFDKSVLHLHGQHTGFVLCNTESEVNEQANRLQEIFNKLNQNSLWIIVGYSGDNDATFNLLKREKTFEHRLFWVGYKDNEPNTELQDKLLGENKYAFYIKGYNADDFFVTLARRLDSFPPDFINRPFSYLKRSLDEINNYKMPGDNVIIPREDINSATKNIIEEAIINIENNNVKMAKHYFSMGLNDCVLPLLEKSTEDEQIEILKLLDDDIDQVTEVTKREMSKLEKKINTYDKSIDNLIDYTQTLRFMAIADKNESEEYLKKACDSYFNGIKDNEDSKLLFKEWGETLKEFVGMSENDEIYLKYCTTYLEAVKKYLANNKIDLSDELFIKVNNLSYDLILNNNFDMAKKLLDLALSYEPKTFFPYATMGLWFLRNENIEIEISKENGMNYYEKAIKMCESIDDIKETWYEGLLQKYYYELAVFYLNRLEDKESAKDYCLRSYEIGEIELLPDMYKEINEIMGVLNITKFDDEVAVGDEEV